jgi:hypothetical protein
MMNSTTLNDLGPRASSHDVEVFALWADASHTVVRELVDFTASAAKEGVRLYAEIQSSAVEAVKDGHAFLRGDVQAEKAFKLLEGNAQAITRSAERLQVTAQQAAKEIQAAFAQLASKVTSL